jgi:DNA-binding YbaB/EbfC family protein
VSKPPFDLSQVMAQAEQMGTRLREAQEQLRHRSVEATVGGGMVTVRINGKLEVISIEIDPQAVDKRDVEMLQDLIVAATNEALRRAQEMMQQELQKLTGFPLGALLGGQDPS